MAQAGSSHAAERRAALKELYLRAQGCVRCTELAATREKVVFGAGNADADLMFVGEAPGANEDRLGLPFVGQAGKLLDKLLGEIGLERGDVFIANALKCRPPGNRDPLPEEISNCRDYLFEQVELIEPRVVCSLGNFSTKLLRNDPAGITRVHGQPEVITIGRRAVRLYPIYHPAAALYTPAHARDPARGLRTAARAARAAAAPAARRRRSRARGGSRRRRSRARSRARGHVPPGRARADPARRPAGAFLRAQGGLGRRLSRVPGVSSRSRRARHLLASLLLGGTLALPAAAAAQTGSTTTPGAGNSPTLSQQPPVSLGGSKSKPKATTPAPKRSTTATAPARLPNTGYDVVQVGLLGLVLVLLGIGLRLRTRDVRWR